MATRNIPVGCSGNVCVVCLGLILACPPHLLSSDHYTYKLFQVDWMPEVVLWERGEGLSQGGWGLSKGGEGPVVVMGIGGA